MVCLALIVYCTGISTLVMFPSAKITWWSWVIFIGAVIAVIGLIAHAIEPIVLPGEKYAYLITGITGLMTIILYDWRASVPWYSELRTTLFLITGIIGSIGAFVAQQRGTNGKPAA